MRGNRAWRACARYLGLGMLALAAGCAHAPTAPDALLSVKADPPAAQVYVDEQPLFREPDGTRQAVRGGTIHRVEVRLPGYFTAYREVVVPSHGRRDVQVTLRPDPDQNLPALPVELLSGGR